MQAVAHVFDAAAHQVAAALHVLHVATRAEMPRRRTQQDAMHVAPVVDLFERIRQRLCHRDVQRVAVACAVEREHEHAVVEG
jgi:hypothetical protein